MKEETRWGVFVVCPVLAVAAIALVIRGVAMHQNWATAAARWDKGEDHPLAITITRQDNAPSEVRLAKTMSATEIKEDWCHCSIGTRGSFGKTIMRYPSVHEVQKMHKWASDPRRLVDQCAPYSILNATALDSFQVASTTDAISLKYAPDGKELTFCFLAPEKLSQEDRVVLWSDSSPESYP